MRPDTRQPAGPPAAGNDDQILAGDNPVVSFSRYRARKRLRRTNVLVVVDDHEGYMRIRNFLGESRDTRFVCTYCRDFDTSVEAIRSKKFDIALVDHRIGARSGLDLIRDAGGPLAPTPMILLTGHGDHDIDLAALDAGAGDYLDKNGLSAEALERAIRYVRAHYETEQRLKASERRMHESKIHAEAANASKSEFLARMSHELRTPLNAVIGFSDILMNERFGPLGADKYREYAEDIHVSGQHLLELITDLLDLSKIEAGKFELHEQTVNLGEAIRASMRLVRERADAAGLNLNAWIPDNMPLVRVDGRTFRQIVLNLLSNAIKFTPEGGSITVTAGPGADGGVAVSVVDSGIGIAPEDIDQALAPFGQIDGLVARKHAGTGLGLPLARSLMELHGGTLTVESAVGTGTTVTVRFPPERVVERFGLA